MKFASPVVTKFLHLKDHSTQIKRSIYFVLCLAVILSPAQFIAAQVMSSSSYTIQSDILGEVGSAATSASYGANSVLGELATGETSASTNYNACFGYECMNNPPFISFSVTQGLTSPGTVGAGIAFGTLSTSAITTSNDSSVNKIFLTVSSNSSRGTSVAATSANGGLKRTSAANIIPSATTTLVVGSEGYGICVAEVSQTSDSPTVLSAVSPYNSTCNTTNGHSVGRVNTISRNIVTASGAIKSGTVTVLVKVGIATSTTAGSDYSDTLNFIASSTY